MAVTFDTMKFVETLERANLTREQASAIAAAVRDSHNASDVAIRQDLRELRTEMELVRKDLIIKLGGMLVAGFGVVIGLMLKLSG